MLGLKLNHADKRGPLCLLGGYMYAFFYGVVPWMNQNVSREKCAIHTSWNTVCSFLWGLIQHKYTCMSKHKRAPTRVMLTPGGREVPSNANVLFDARRLFRSQSGKCTVTMEDVAWWSLLVLMSWYPIVLFKLLLLIWRLGAVWHPIFKWVAVTLIVW